MNLKKYYEMQCFVHIVDVQIFGMNETFKITRYFLKRCKFQNFTEVSLFSSSDFFVQKQYFSKQTGFFYLFLICYQCELKLDFINLREN